MDELQQKLGWSGVGLILFLISGFIILCIWFFRTSFGRKALLNSLPRRNNMHPAVPFVVMLAYFALMLIAGSSIKHLFKFSEETWQFVFAANFTMSVSAIIIIVVVIFLARRSFARRLKGFGLNPRTILRDLPVAFLNFWATLPVVIFMIIATAYAGKFLIGPDFKIEQHQELGYIAKFDANLAVVIAVFFTVVVIAPVLEEFLFRGLLQTAIRSFGYGPWFGIAVSSALFAIVHADLSHWPAIFFLSAGIGYSFEKSGSLFRPIFFHSLFNAFSVIGTLLLSNASA